MCSYLILQYERNNISVALSLSRSVDGVKFIYVRHASSNWATMLFEG